MNSRFLLSLACATGLVAAIPATANARDEAARNAIIGGIAGAVIGEHNDHHAAEGAVIGVAAGLLLTALTDDSRCDRSETYYEAPPRYRETVVVSRPYCPPPRVVVVTPPPRPHYREVVVVRPPHYPEHRTVIVSPRHDRHEDRREARYDRHDSRHDRRNNRHERREDRRDDRHDRRYDRYVRD